jgi:hypothetical protein
MAARTCLLLLLASAVACAGSPVRRGSQPEPDAGAAADASPGSRAEGAGPKPLTYQHVHWRADGRYLGLVVAEAGNAWWSVVDTQSWKSLASLPVQGWREARFDSSGHFEVELVPNPEGGAGGAGGGDEIVRIELPSGSVTRRRAPPPDDAAPLVRELVPESSSPAEKVVFATAHDPETLDPAKVMLRASARLVRRGEPRKPEVEIDLLALGRKLLPSLTRVELELLDAATAIAWFIDGSQFIRRMALIDLASGKAHPVAKLLGPGGALLPVADGLLIVQGPGAPVVQLDRKGKVVRQLHFPGAARKQANATDPIADTDACLAILPASKRLELGGYSEPLRLFEWPGGRLIAAVPAEGIHRSATWRECNLSFSPDGTRLVHWGRTGFVLAVAASDGRVQRAEDFSRAPDRDTAVGVIEWHSEGLLSPDARFFAVSSEDEPVTVRVVDLEKGESTILAAGRGAPSWSPDGRLLVAGGTVWRLPERQKLASRIGAPR